LRKKNKNKRRQPYSSSDSGKSISTSEEGHQAKKKKYKSGKNWTGEKWVQTKSSYTSTAEAALFEELMQC